MKHLLVAVMLIVASGCCHVPGPGSKEKGSSHVKTPTFPEYDNAFLAAIQRAWYAQLNQYQGPQKRGKVIIDFRLTDDRRITDLS